MARIRSVKPEFWTDRKLARLTRDARLLYIALWNQSDEWGRVHGDTRYVKGHCLPYDDDLSLGAVDRLLAELDGAGHLIRYEADGDPYLYLPKLAKHQRLEPNKVPSRLPEPPSVQVREMSEPRAEKSAPRTDEPAPDAETFETIVALQVAGSRGQVAGGRGQEGPPAAAPDGAAMLDVSEMLGGNGAGIVSAYVEACREVGQVVDKRAKGRIAKEGAELLRDGAPYPLLVEAARRLAVNGFADIGAEARRLIGQQAPRQSTTDAKVAQTLRLAESFADKDTA